MNNNTDQESYTAKAMSGNLLIVETFVPLPNRGISKKTFVGNDFYLDNTANVLYVCADKNHKQAIAAFNMNYVLSFRIEDNYINL